MVLADYRDIWEVGRIWTENSWHVHTLCEFFSVVGSFSDDNPVCYIYIYISFLWTTSCFLFLNNVNVLSVDSILH